MQYKSGYTLSPLGDSAIIIKFGNTIDMATHIKIRQFIDLLDKSAIDGMIELVPAYTTVTVFYHFPTISYKTICHKLETLLLNLSATSLVQAQTVEIPVCYSKEYGKDLNTVAEINDLSVDEVIEIHSGGDYCVYMLGFAPGFPYLGGLSKQIAAPRKEIPRLVVPAGSVGIGGQQTGVYPMEMPGGWQLIGKTPLKLFDPWKNPPCILNIGDQVRFKAITKEEFLHCSSEAKEY